MTSNWYKAFRFCLFWGCVFLTFGECLASKRHMLDPLSKEKSKKPKTYVYIAPLSGKRTSYKSTEDINRDKLLLGTRPKKTDWFLTKEERQENIQEIMRLRKELEERLKAPPEPTKEKKKKGKRKRGRPKKEVELNEVSGNLGAQKKKVKLKKKKAKRGVNKSVPWSEKEEKKLLNLARRKGAKLSGPLKKLQQIKVAEQLNKEFGNGRSPGAVKAKYNELRKQKL